MSIRACPPLGRFETAVALAITVLVQTTVSLLSATVPVLAPEIAADRGWSVTLIALYPAIVFSTALLTSFQVPGLLRHLGGMGLSLGCVAFSSLGLLCLLLPGALIAFSAIAIGMATGAMNPASSQILGPRTAPGNAGLIMSIKQTGVPMGAMMAGMIVPVLVLSSGWSGTVPKLAFASLGIVLALSPIVPRLNDTERLNPIARYRLLEPVKRVLAMPGMLRFLVAAMAFSAMQLCLRSFFTVHLVTKVGLDFATAAVAFGISQGAGIAGQIFWAWISDRLLTPHAVMAILGLLMTIGAVLTAFVTREWPIVAVELVAVIYGISAAGFIPVVLGEVARHALPAEVGALTSGAQLFLMGGVLAGPPLFGALAASISYAAAFVVLGGCTLAGSIVAAIPLRDQPAPLSRG